MEIVKRQINSVENRIPVSTELIPNEAFKAITRHIPIMCVDVVIREQDKGVLLGKRLNNPAKGEFFTIGGRQNKGETLEETAKRKAKDEAGIDVRIVRPVGLYNITFGKAYENMTVPAHYVDMVYLVEKVGGSTNFKSETSDLSKFTFVKDLNQEQHHPQPLQLILDSAALEPDWKKPRPFQIRDFHFE